MRTINKVILVGHVGADPEKRGGSGYEVSTFTLATNSPGADGKDVAEWHRITAWNGRYRNLSDVCGLYVQKGAAVYVEGRIHYSTWKDNAGITRYATEIVATEINVLGGGKRPASAPVAATQPNGNDGAGATTQPEGGDNDSIPF
jgi:single-strand DNA-binding protein